MNNFEKEIIILNACSSIINDMVNRSIFTICNKDDSLVVTDEEIQLLPHTEVHQKFFNILLVEFLSGPNKKILGLEQIPQNDKEIGYLYYLKGVCESPSLSPYDGKLQETVDDFIKWLKEEFIIEKCWFPSIDQQLDIKIARWQFIKICGDLSKHGFIRLDKRVEDIVSVFENNHVKINKEQAYLILPEFYEWFHNDVFNYHINTIAEFLNKINWAIYDYVRPIREDKNLKIQITNQVAENMYYDLQKFRPYVSKFNISKCLKMRY